MRPGAFLRPGRLTPRQVYKRVGAQEMDPSGISTCRQPQKPRTAEVHWSFLQDTASWDNFGTVRS